MKAWFTPGACQTPRDVRSQIASLYYTYAVDVLTDLMSKSYPGIGAGSLLTNGSHGPSYPLDLESANATDPKARYRCALWDRIHSHRCCHASSRANRWKGPIQLTTLCLLACAMGCDRDQHRRYHRMLSGFRHIDQEPYNSKCELQHPGVRQAKRRRRK